MIGQSPLFRAMLDLVRQAAPSSATVLITGESGTGKELVARALHALSSRHAGPFVAVNCAALPETILESELFGYERGAFTGATARKEGRFDRADEGTLLLDEIAVQEGEFERLGGVAPVKVDVRLVAATNRDLLKAVKEGRFREDLYYRLNVIAIALPPLRDRAEDVPLLAEHFLRRFAKANGKALTGIAREAIAALVAYSWPGNVRELENTLERAVVLSRGVQLTLEDFPPSIRAAGAVVPSSANAAMTPASAEPGFGGMLAVPLGTPLEEVERLLIRETLRYTRGDKTMAARLLGIAPRTIYRKLDREPDKDPET
jgi:two-component system response regulator HydG